MQNNKKQYTDTVIIAKITTQNTVSFVKNLERNKDSQRKKERDS